MMYEIVKPCSEDWKKMTPVEGGRFCSKCKKKVHDLEGNHSLPASDEICGMKHQNTIRFINYRSLTWYRKPLHYATVFLALLFSRNAEAQSVETETSDTSSNKKITPDDKNLKNITITGVLEDNDSKEGIPFASVVVYDEQNNQLGYASTDFGGAYRIDLRDIKGKYLSLKAVYVGYESVVVKDIPLTSAKRNINIKLRNSNVLGLGIIVVGSLDWTKEYDAFGQKRAFDGTEWRHSPK